MNRNDFYIDSLKLQNLIEDFILSSVEDGIKQGYFSEHDRDLEILEQVIIQQIKQEINEYLGD